MHFFHTYKQKVDYVFVDHPTFLERVNGQTGSKLYGPEWGKDFADNQAVGQGVSHGGMADGVMTDMVGTWVIFVDSIYLVENCCDVNSRVFCWICVRYIMNLTI